MKHGTGKIALIILWLAIFSGIGWAAGFHVGILGDRTGGATPEVFTQVVRSLQALHPDLVINVGDLIEGPQPDEKSINAEWDTVYKSLDLFSVPLRFVPGNNDIFDEKSRDIYEQRTHCKPSYSFDFQNAHFLVIDTSQLKSIAELPHDQLAWIEDDLKQNKDKDMTLVFFHKPFWFDAFEKNEPFALHELFKENNVRWVFSGHYHTYLYEEKDGITYVMVGSSGAAIGDNENQGQFYQYGWLTIDGKLADFALLKADAVVPDDFVTLPKWQEIEKIEAEFLTIQPVHLTDKKQTSFPFTLDLKNLQDYSGKGSYAWKCAGTPWTITPESGRYDCRQSSRLSMTASLKGETIYPLPVLTMDYPKKNGEPYPIHRPIAVVREVTVPATAKAPRIDGILDDSCWKKAAVLQDFGDDKGRVSKIEPWETRLVRTGDALTVGVKAKESQPEKAIIASVERDGPVYEGDCIYLIFWCEGKAPVLTQFIINPDGRILDRHCPIPANGETKPAWENAWNASLEIGHQRMATDWNLEIRIPLSDLGIDAAEQKRDMRLRCNVIRYQSRLDDMALWHYPATFSSQDSEILVVR